MLIKCVGATQPKIKRNSPKILDNLMFIHTDNNVLTQVIKTANYSILK